MMCSVVDIDIIETEIIPHLPKSKRGYVTKSKLSEIVNAILYKLKTGVQWKLVPVESLFSNVVLSWQSVYHHFRKWSKASAWNDCWIHLLSKYKSGLDLSSSDLDGSHSKALRGGEEVGYQGRKKCKTTNAIFLTDRNGVPISMSKPIAGNHHDVFEIKAAMNHILLRMDKADISYNGLFMNADAGFDCIELKALCSENEIILNVDENRRNNQDSDNFFDDKMYDDRYMIERTNAWIDTYRSVLTRFDTTITSWESLNILACVVICLKKLVIKKV